MAIAARPTRNSVSHIGPSAPTAMRTNRNEPPQMAASRTRRARSAGRMFSSPSPLGATEQRLEGRYSAHFTGDGRIAPLPSHHRAIRFLRLGRAGITLARMPAATEQRLEGRYSAHFTGDGRIAPLPSHHRAIRFLRLGRAGITLARMPAD